MLKAPSSVTGFELRRLKRHLNLNDEDMAAALGLADAGEYRQYERGKKKADRAMAILAHRLSSARPADPQDKHRFLLLDDLDGDQDITWLLHTQYPRFYAWLMTDQKAEELADRLGRPQESLTRKVVIHSFIDRPQEHRPPPPELERAMLEFIGRHFSQAG